MGERYRIDELFDLQMGKTPPRKEPKYWTEGNIDWVSIGDLSRSDKYVGTTKERINNAAIHECHMKQVPANTLIMSFKLSIGKTAITTSPTYTNEAIMAFLDKHVMPLDLDYLYHLFSSRDWLSDTNAAVMGATLNKKTLGEQKIIVPSLAEQRKIAEHLAAVQSQISVAKQMLAKADELIQTHFVEMFGDLISNPFGLPIVIVGDVLSVQPANGLYKPQRDYVTDMTGTPIVRIDSFRSEGPDYTSLKRLNCSHDEIRRYGLAERDIVINRVNSVGCMGKTMLVKNMPEPVVFESNMMRLHSDESRILPEFLCAQMTMEQSKFYFESHAKRAIGQASINQKDVKQLPILLPSIAAQAEYLEFVTQVESLKATARRQLDRLNTLYDSLAQRYFAE